MYSLLVLLAILPSTSAFVDCRAACRICRDQSEHPSALEVHCAMCEECKLRRRDSLGSGDNHRKAMPTIMMQHPNMVKPMGSLPAFPGYGAGYPPGYPGYPGFMPPMMPPPMMLPPMYQPPPPPHMIPEFSEDCPTPPTCGSTTTPTESAERIPLKATTIITTSTSTTTSKPPATRRPSPPAPACIKRQVMVPPMPLPMMNIVPGFMMPAYGVGVMPCAGIPQPPIVIHQPISETQAQTTHAPRKTDQTPTTVKTTNATTIQDIDNVLPDMRSGRQEQHVKHVITKETTSKDFFYVYVGLPKKGANINKDPTRMRTE